MQGFGKRDFLKLAAAGSATSLMGIPMQALAQAAKGGVDAEALREARAGVQAAKVALGERGPVWWDDGSADLNRHKVGNTPYAQWYEGLQT